MSNRLTKRSRITYTAEVPAQVATPAYCVTGPGFKIVYVSSEQLNNSGIQTAPDYPPIIKSHLDAFGRKVVDEILIPVKVASNQVTTCYPAMPAVPGVEAAEPTDQYLGWNSGARSVGVATGDFEISCTFPPSPNGGVLFGIGPASGAVGSFSGIEHGLYSAGSFVKFYESGVERFSFSATSAVAPLMRIRRIRGVVTALVGNESYRSNSKSSGDKSAMAALYASGDYVENPAITKASSGYSAAELSLGNSAGRPPSISSRDSLIMRDAAYGKNSNQAVVPVIPLDGVSTVFDMAMRAQDSGTYTDPGVFAAEIPVGIISSEEFYSAIKFTLDEPKVSAYDTDQLLQASILEGLFQDSVYDFEPMIFASINETLNIGSIFEVSLIIDARLMEFLSISNPANAVMILEAFLKSGLAISDYSAQARSQATQYATNIATGAVTRYTGFGFESFCRVGTDLWATRPDGLYKIEGDTDNGSLLSYLVDFAADDQKTARTKRLENIFFGISTDGVTYAKLTDDFGRDKTYRLIHRDASESRINTAKGASSRYWQLRLEGEDASFCEIDNIEWVAATGSRRTKR